MTIRRAHRSGGVSGGGAGQPAARSETGWFGTLALAWVVVAGLGTLVWLARADTGGASSGSAGPAATVTVDATKGWQTTGVTVTAGTRLRLAVTTGEWTYWVGSSPLQPGTGDDYICANIMPVAVCVEPMPSERKGALIGRIGGGEPFLVGQRNEITADRSGLVELRINDPDSALFDNGGSRTVALGDAATDPYAAPSQVPSTPPPAATAAPSREPPDEPPAVGPTAAPATPVPPTAPPTAAPAESPQPALPRALPRTGGGGMAGERVAGARGGQ
jgi:hypothetical protein